jgi:Cu/Ag efflux protein CusF
MSNKFLLGVVILLTLTLSGSVAAQEKSPTQAPEPPRREMGGERVMGTVASVGVDRFELKKADGTTQTVLVNDQTHYRQQQQEFQLEDLKPGDHVFVRGNPNSDKQFVASIVRRMSEQEMQRFESGSERAGGEIISIDQNQIKVRNPRQGEKIIAINAQTTFTRQGQAITLKDLKVGDRIFAIGKEEQGQFVATQVRTGWMGQGRGGWQPQ